MAVQLRKTYTKEQDDFTPSENFRVAFFLVTYEPKDDRPDTQMIPAVPCFEFYAEQMEADDGKGFFGKEFKETVNP